MTGGIIETVEPRSLAGRLGLHPGDVLLEINGHPLRDVLDVQFYAADESLDLRVLRGDPDAASGEETVYHAEREYGVPLGLGFTTPTFDGIRRCHNACEFCFVAQMPARRETPGLRPSLYVRDDDYRYSVLYGSFVTLTDLTADDWQRFEEQRLSPLYVSVHATEGDLRRRLLGRTDSPPDAAARETRGREASGPGDVLRQIDRLLRLGIDVHAQIVLVPGVNDGRHLDRSISDLVARYPGVLSIGVVPVGLTRYHRGGCRTYTAQEAREIVDQITPVQTAYRTQFGASVVHLADEWYLLAGLDVPPDESYDGYPQIENGIGLVRRFLEDSRELRAASFRSRVRDRAHGSSCTLVCGTLMAPILGKVAEGLATRSGLQVKVVPVVNQLFGETVTVSGLLGGEDVLCALKDGGTSGEIVFLPRAMFARPPDGSDDMLTLDGLSVCDVEERLGRQVVLAEYLSEVWKRIGGRHD